MKTQLAILLVCAASSGCAAESHEDAEPAPTEDEITARAAGIVLRSADDPDLEITLKTVDAKQQRSIHLRARRGEKALTMECTGGGQLGEGRGHTQTVACEDPAQLESRFALSFTKWNEREYILEIDAFGEGARERLQILSALHIKPDSIGLEAVRGMGSTADPFVHLAAIGTRLEGIVGAEVADRMNEKQAVRWLRYSVSSEVEVSTALVLSLTDSRSTHAVSALATPGVLTSGLAPAGTLTERVLGAVR